MITVTSTKQLLGKLADLENEQRLGRLELEMNEFYQQHSGRRVEPLTVGELYAASVFGTLMRVRVTSVGKKLLFKFSSDVELMQDEIIIVDGHGGEVRIKGLMKFIDCAYFKISHKL